MTHETFSEYCHMMGCRLTGMSEETKAKLQQGYEYYLKHGQIEIKGISHK